VTGGLATPLTDGDLRGSTSVGPRNRVNAQTVSQPLATVRRVEGHHLEAHCECGARWSVYVDDEIDPDDVQPECAVWGATVVDVRALGPHHSAGRDVEP